MPKARRKPAPKAPATRMVPLVALAHARSGDKGDTANVGLIASRPSTTRCW